MAFTLVAIVCAIVAGVAIAVGSTRRHTISVERSAVTILGHLQRRSSWALAAGCAAGIALAGLLLSNSSHLGILASIGPSAGGVLALMVTCVAELTTPHPEGHVRSASLVDRRLKDSIDTRGLWTAALSVTGLVLLLTLGWALGAPDYMGSHGRLLSCGTSEDGGARGPWPGSYYAGPMLVGAAVVALATAVTVLSIARRPRASVADPATDRALRQESTRRVMLICTGVASTTLAPVAWLMSIALIGISCSPWWWSPLGWLCAAITIAASAMGPYSLANAIAGPVLTVRDRESATLR